MVSSATYAKVTLILKDSFSIHSVPPLIMSFNHPRLILQFYHHAWLLFCVEFSDQVSVLHGKHDFSIKVFKSETESIEAQPGF